MKADFLVLLKAIAILIVQVGGDFDCRREGMGCNGGTCVPETGVCSDCDQLTPPRQGFDCGLITDSVHKGGCSSTLCKNAGTCYATDDDVPRCYCQEDYYGDTCSYRRFDASSTADKMVININPLPGFSGRVYISGQVQTSSCLLLPVPSPPDDDDDVPDHWEGYYGSFSHTGGVCGDARTNSTTKIRQVTIQFKLNYLTGLDLQVSLISTLDIEGVDVYAASFSVTADDNLKNQEVVTSTFNPVTMATTTLDGAALSDSPVLVGTVVVFTFSVPVNDFSALRLEKVIANNSLSGDSAESITLVTGGCVDKSVLSVVEGVPGPADPGVKSTIKFKLRTFKFLSSDQIALMFVVKVCIVDSDCDPPSCPVSSRTRRSLDQDETVLSEVIRVRETQDRGDTGEPPTQDSPDTHFLFTATVTSEGVVLALFSILLIVLVKRYCSRRKDNVDQHTQTDRALYTYYPLQ